MGKRELSDRTDAPGFTGFDEPGKLADLVLPDDIFTVPPEAIEKTKVDMAIFDGKVIYQR
jgi:predicted amidohydrolase YtcJ